MPRAMQNFTCCRERGRFWGMFVSSSSSSVAALLTVLQLCSCLLIPAFGNWAFSCLPVLSCCLWVLEGIVCCEVLLSWQHRGSMPPPFCSLCKAKSSLAENTEFWNNEIHGVKEITFKCVIIRNLLVSLVALCLCTYRVEHVYKHVML